MSDQRMKKGKICVILPALNEELTLGKVIDEIPCQTLDDEGYHVEVVVVDNNSTDGTRQVALAKGARVIDEPRRGKGRAVRTALASVKADFIFMLDSDYTYPALYIPEMVKILCQGHSVVIGSRLRGRREKGAMGKLNLFGNFLLSLMASILYQKRISDLCTGCWGFRGEIIPKLKLAAEGFQLEAELFTQLAKKGYRVAEIPIYYRSRAAKTKLNRIKDGIKIGKMLLARRF